MKIAGNQNTPKRAFIFVHGRGGTAQDILSLSKFFPIEDDLLLAPQAPNNTWYPQAFIAPIENNQPYLKYALEKLKNTVNFAIEKGIDYKNIYFLGFSQGACLTLEFIARNAQPYGGAAAYSGGLIGQKLQISHYGGNFEGTPIFIGSSNPDFHIPVERVYASTNILKDLGAEVTEKIYPNMGHTINQDEVEITNQLFFGK